MLQRRVLWAFAGVVATTLFGIAGYYLIGRGRWPLLDCAYMTIITLTTVGYAEVLPVQSTVLGRPFTILLLAVGVVSVWHFIATFSAFLVEGEISGLRWRKRMERFVKQLSGHIIVCGAGSTGIHCVRELEALDVPFAVVDRQEEVARAVTEAHGGAAVVGDATHDQVLREAGIERARGVIAALTDDKDNLYVTVSARALNPALRIVAKAIDVQAEAKLRRAGADSVVSPNVIGGLRLVWEMVRPESTTLLDALLRRRDQPLRVQDVKVPPGSALAGRPVAELDLSRRGLLLLAVRDPEAEGGRHTYNPPADYVVSGGSILVVLGEPEQVRHLAAQAETP